MPHLYPYLAHTVFTLSQCLVVPLLTPRALGTLRHDAPRAARENSTLPLSSVPNRLPPKREEGPANIVSSKHFINTLLLFDYPMHIHWPSHPLAWYVLSL